MYPRRKALPSSPHPALPSSPTAIGTALANLSLLDLVHSCREVFQPTPFFSIACAQLGVYPRGIPPSIPSNRAFAHGHLYLPQNQSNTDTHTNAMESVRYKTRGGGIREVFSLSSITSTASALFSQTPPGWGYPVISSRGSQRDPPLHTVAFCTNRLAKYCRYRQNRKNHSSATTTAIEPPM